MIFQTPRLIVRPLRIKDLHAFHQMQSDEQVMRYTTGKPFDLQENLRQLQRCIEKYDQPADAFFVWAAELKASTVFAGTCALVRDDSGEFEIGYRLRREFWSQGLGSELAAGLIDYCLGPRGLPRVVAHADVRNVASIRILEKAMHFVRQELHPGTGGLVRHYERPMSSRASGSEIP